MNDHTPWSEALTVAKYGKWTLGLFALNYYGWLIDLGAGIAVVLVLVALVADRIRTRRLLRRWDDHCQDIADQWAGNQRGHQATTTAPAPVEWRAAA